MDMFCRKQITIYNEIKPKLGKDSFFLTNFEFGIKISRRFGMTSSTKISSGRSCTTQQLMSNVLRFVAIVQIFAQ